MCAISIGFIVLFNDIIKCNKNLKLTQLFILMQKKFKSFFHKTLVTFAIYAFIAQFFVLTSVFLNVIKPLIGKNIQDIINVSFHHFKTLQELHNDQTQLPHTLGNSGFILNEINDEVNEYDGYLFYVTLAKKHIQKTYNINSSIKINTDDQGHIWYWMNLQNQQYKGLHIGFSDESIIVKPLLIWVSIFLPLLFFIIITSFLVAKNIVKPVKQLHKKVKLLGSGNFTEVLQYDEYKTSKTSIEFIELNEQVNKTSVEVHSLLSNRTILLTGIAHDLRTPLTQIKLTLDLLDKKNQKTVQSIEEDIERMEDLISDSLNLGLDVYKNEKELDKSIHINSLLEDIVNNTPKEGTEIKISLMEEDDYCKNMHPKTFERIIHNFLSNAIRYGQKNLIEVVARRDVAKQQIIIEIKDCGIGIPKNELESVFKPFYRLEKSRNMATGGKGVGLAIVKQLAQTHDWNVFIKQRKDGGVVATLVIPV